ncbi:DNA (cytosine-5)-methyltransferase 1 [Parabacteroides sp. PFB2-12]|uniref:DNA cytosine methyltransferase n=1 Tax=unclassified Parabacteroides TaxID=2649774 RepID=UPI0024755D14|nr:MULTISPECIES: DNA cytosine methyltransferase [unclassified Parabacteroides]MDH6343748.1 DNA (cytosine-5)-methyltransferase 1 [Parabacteroides sp. PM6-13]MDH6391910.1 DNA (cytosine-5)-methyltransferase 1 [Parabacteroides sp. PFB2-12]
MKMKNKMQNIQNTKANIDASESDWTKKSFCYSKHTIRLGTSFSGIGAIEHAFERLGLNYEIQFAGDIDKDCKQSYLANYEIDESRWHNDIHNFDAKPYKGKIDLFVGGAPCQAFSIRGKRGGFEDTRGTLFSEFARVVIECQPKVFIFENVKGMLSHDKGNTWKTIKKTFETDCGYDVYYQILNGKDYGIPQSRERLFCIGFRKKTNFKFPKPIQLTTTMYDYLDRNIDDKLFLKTKGVNFVTRSINRQKSYTQINGNIMLCQKRNQQFNWHGDFVFHPLGTHDNTMTKYIDYIFNVNDYEENYYVQKNIGKYCLIKKNDNLAMAPNTIHYNNSKGFYRKLSPRECLRLMGFDDSFKIVTSNTACYKQAGNSIIVNILIALLKQMDITKIAYNG